MRFREDEIDISRQNGNQINNPVKTCDVSNRVRRTVYSEFWPGIFSPKKQKGGYRLVKLYFVEIGAKSTGYQRWGILFF